MKSEHLARTLSFMRRYLFCSSYFMNTSKFPGAYTPARDLNYFEDIISSDKRLRVVRYGLCRELLIRSQVGFSKPLRLNVNCQTTFILFTHLRSEILIIIDLCISQRIFSPRLSLYSLNMVLPSTHACKDIRFMMNR